MDLNDRQIAFLRVMQDGRERHPGQIFREAFPDAEHRGRRDAGATRTLDGLRRLGLVSDRYPSYDATGRFWRINGAGKDELRERGLLTPPEPVGLAHRMNGVPEHVGWIYGLAQRSGESVEVDVHGPDGTKLHVKGIGWAGENGIHAVAQRMIDEHERLYAVEPGGEVEHAG